MKVIKSFLLAFLVGGLFAVLGQILAMIVWQIPMFAGYETIVLLLCVAFLGGTLFALGLWDKLSEIGGMGATLSLAGPVAAFAGIATEVALQTQSLAKGALVATKEIMVKVIGCATLICMLLGTVVFFGDGGSLDLGVQAADFSETTGGSVPPVVPAYVAVSEGAVGTWLTNVLTVPGPSLGLINIVFAFLITGSVCAFIQLLIMKVKLSLSPLLAALMVSGACLTIVGAVDPLLEYAGGGFQILVIDAGQAVIQLFCFALAGGIPGAVPFIMVLGLFAAMTVFGTAAAAIRISHVKKTLSESKQEKPK